MKKGLIVTLFILAVLLSGCQKETETITVVLDWTPNTNHTGLYVALENGYYLDEGLDVEIIQPSGTSEALVGSNTAQFGISAQEYVIAARSNEIPVVSIASIIYDNSSGFISRKESNISTPKDFEDKTYCGWGSDTESEIIKELITSDNGDFNKVNITTNYLDIFTDVNKDCDFFWVFEAWQVQQAMLENIEYDYLSMIDYSSDLNFHTPVLITNEEMLTNNLETVQAFIDAVSKGYAYAIDNPAESADILLKHAPELNVELVKASQLFISTIYKKEDVVWGMQSDAYWTDFYTWLNANGIISDITISDAYTNEFINE